MVTGGFAFSILNQCLSELVGMFTNPATEHQATVFGETQRYPAIADAQLFRFTVLLLFLTKDHNSSALMTLVATA